MFVADSIIKKEGKSLITPFENERVGPISYDLSAKEFHTTKDGEIVTQSEISLLPGESVFVSCEETITLPGDMAAVINARNSRIRQGLRIDAPIYYPGHKTRVFFRVSNVSKECIVFSKKEKYAAIYFVKVDGTVEKPYKGEFENELSFKGMGEYRGEYEQAMRKIKERVEDLKSMEKGIYANVLVLLTIFVALFSLVNINVDLVRNGTGADTMFQMLVFNLAMVGSIGLLISFVQIIIKNRSINAYLLFVGILCFAAALFFSTWI